MAANLAGIARMNASAAAHPHGSYVRYNAGCRCQECRAGKSQYDGERRKARARGESNAMVSADSCQAHVFALVASGVEVEAIAIASGLPQQRIHSIRRGAQQKVRQVTERAILNLTVACAVYNGLQPAKLTRQRLKAIRRKGISAADIRRRLGMHPKAGLAHREFVRHRTARAVRKLYDEVIRIPSMKSLGIGL